MRSIGIGAPRPTEPRSGEGHPAPATKMKNGPPRGGRFHFCTVGSGEEPCSTKRGSVLDGEAKPIRVNPAPLPNEEWFPLWDLFSLWIGERLILRSDVDVRFIPNAGLLATVPV